MDMRNLVQFGCHIWNRNRWHWNKKLFLQVFLACKSLQAGDQQIQVENWKVTSLHFSQTTMIKNQFPFSTTCGIKCFNLNLNGDYYIDLYSDISHSFRLHMSVLMHQAFRTPLYTLCSRGDCSIYAGQVLMGSNYRLYSNIYIIKNRSTCVNREAYRFFWFIRWGNDWMIPKPCKTAAIRTLQQYFPPPHPKLTDFSSSCKWQMWKSLTLYRQRHPKKQCDVMGKKRMQKSKRCECKVQTWIDRSRIVRWLNFKVINQYNNN